LKHETHAVWSLEGTLPDEHALQVPPAVGFMVPAAHVLHVVV